MPDPTADFSALADQVKTLTATLQLVQKKLALDLNILNNRFEQLNDRINKAAIGPQLISLFFTPALDGEWVGGTTSPEFVTTEIIRTPVEGQSAFPEAQGVAGFLSTPQEIAFGRMPVHLPDHSRIQRFRCSCRFLFNENDGQTSFTVGLERMSRHPDSEIEDVVRLELQDDQERTGDPNPGMEVVENDSFEYSIFAELTILPAEVGVAMLEGGAVLESFEVDCIVG